MKKTDFGINLDSEFDSGWVDMNTYVTNFDLADDTDSLGNVMTSWLEVSFNKSKREVHFLRYTETEDGNGDNYDIEKYLSRKTIKAIMAKVSERVGITFVI